MHSLWPIYINAFWLVIAMALLTWVYSFIKSNVNIVDSLWSLMFLGAGSVYFNAIAYDASPRQWLVYTLLILWSLRLSAHLFIRNLGHDEDRRYREIRKNNQPNFALKSIYIVFGLQAFLAWIISIPLLFGLNAETPLGLLDAAAIGLWSYGFLIETFADWQLFKFQKNKNNKGKVLDAGLWRYSRHPNYFGEFCIWWAFYLFAIQGGGVWTIFSPIIMTLLLFKVSGVGMMEKGVVNRRPEYADYIRTTNTFFLGPKR